MATLRNQVALIAGAGPGLSACLARLFSREGMRVAAAARDTGKLAALAAESGVQTFACDVVDPDQVARLFEEVEGRIGAPDVVVYNASARLRGPLIELRPADVASALGVSAFGGFLVAQRSEEHTSELQSQSNLVCRLLLEKKNNKIRMYSAVSRS